MSRNKLKKAQSYLETCLARVFEKRFQKASEQPFLTMVGSFRDPVWSKFDPGGCLGGSLQGQNCSKMGLKMTQKSSTNVVRKNSENASHVHALSMFPNSSGLFVSLFLLMQRETLCHIYPSKVRTLIHLARENLRTMPIQIQKTTFSKV